MAEKITLWANEIECTDLWTSEREYTEYTSWTERNEKRWTLSGSHEYIHYERTPIQTYVDEESGIVTADPRKFEAWLAKNRLA